MSIQKIIQLALVLICASLLILCRSEEETIEYFNWADDVEYVGSEQCASCHKEIYETFMRTGMGQSFHVATKEKSKAIYTEHTVLYDTLNNFYYQPFWRNDSLVIREFRLNELADTIHKKEMHVRYIVGSGQHTNSHILEENGYLTQAPITFYTQKGIWDIAPGFDSKLASRLNRIVGKECMTCHNSLPDFVEGSENKFDHVPMGIGCERCHGPGGEHLKRKLAGEIVDTSRQADYSIVNPKRLSKDLQMSVCQRCHAQGVAILKEGKDFDDFKPGKHLSEVMEVFLPKFDGYQTQFIMASHADRTAMSECYKQSEMTCISCHNPHVSVKETNKETFDAACKNCHSSKKDLLCSMEESARMAENNNNCYGCHMPVSPSIDIPHVTIHDHYIRKPIPEDAKNQIEAFIGLSNITNPKNKDPLIRAKAYIRFYEAFQSEARMLDSVQVFLDQTKASLQKQEAEIHLAFLKNDFKKIKQLIPSEGTVFSDPWNWYRIGEAFYQEKKWSKAEKFYRKALESRPLNLDFKNKLGSTLMQLGDLTEAKKVFAEIIQENPQHIPALNNLGFVYLNERKIEQATNFYKKALQLNPDYVPALLNQIGLAMIAQDQSTIETLLERVLELEPTNEKALILKEQL